MVHTLPPTILPTLQEGHATVEWTWWRHHRTFAAQTDYEYFRFEQEPESTSRSVQEPIKIFKGPHFYNFWDVFSDQCRHISQKCHTGWEMGMPSISPFTTNDGFKVIAYNSGFQPLARQFALFWPTKISYAQWKLHSTYAASSGVSRKFLWGEGFIQWHMMIILFRVPWLSRHNWTSYSCFQTNVLSKFVDTMHNLLHALSVFHMSLH